jgi:predicted Rossmann fold nucleotide-binding protein DprA/Smf involved in DNA uptake
MDADGRRLAKRDKDLDLTALSRRFTAEELLGKLAFSAGILPEERPASMDELIRRTGLTAAKAGAACMTLRVKGRVRFFPGNRVALPQEA